MEIFGQPETQSEESDLRHLAHAIGSGVSYFVTRDKEILDKSSDIDSAFNVSVLRPVELILQLDQIRNQSNYYPSRLGGTRIQIARVESSEIEDLSKHFLKQSMGEKKRIFNRKLDAYWHPPIRSRPERFSYLNTQHRWLSMTRATLTCWKFRSCECFLGL